MRNDNNLFIGHYHNAVLPMGFPFVHLLGKNGYTYNKSKASLGY